MASKAVEPRGLSALRVYGWTCVEMRTQSASSLADRSTHAQVTLGTAYCAACAGIGAFDSEVSMGGGLLLMHLCCAAST